MENSREYIYKADDARHHFSNDHAKTVIIPADITSLGHNFYAWSQVENFKVANENPHFADDDGVLFDKTRTVLHKYPEGRRSHSYTVPDGVLKIKSNAFSDSSDIFTRFSSDAHEGQEGFTITLPASVTSIEDMAFNSGSRRLGAIHVHEDNPGFSSREGVLFDKNTKTLICCPAGFAKNDYVIPDTVKIIHREGFSGCVHLTRVALPAGLTHIGEHAFEECRNLLEINIPGTVVVISAFSFSYCFKLTNVYLQEGTQCIDTATFGMCNFMKNILIPRSVTNIESTALSLSPSLTIHCHENSFAHEFALERRLSFAFVEDQIPHFPIDGDTIPGALRIDGKALEEQLMGNREIAGLLENIAGMAGPIIIKN